MLYELFFQPIVTIFKYLYLALFSMTGKLGLSLILMSIVVNILLRPFSAWASKIQEKERRIQEILAPQIAEIKRKYHGAEQHSELSELYKRYAYNPLYAIRSGMDLFIQLLPLSAAYVMLSSLTILQGQSFAGISDLSRPDGLIFGINLLPIAMTVINFLTTLTTERFTRRERIQAFVIAILFFTLLYNAPSALLVYWTSNNFIMLLKNLYAKTFGRAHEKISLVLSRQVSPENKLLKFVMFLVPCVLWGVYSWYFFKCFKMIVNINLVPTLEINRYSTEALMYFMFAFTFIMFIFTFVWLLCVHFSKNKFKLSELITRVIYLVLGASVLIITANKVVFTDEFIRHPRFIVIFVLIIQAIYLFGVALLSVPYEKAKLATDILTEGKRNSLFFVVLVFIICLLCVFYPALLYSTDQEFFVGSMFTTIQGVLKYGIGLLIIMMLLWPMIPICLQNIFAALFALSGCIVFINFFVLTANFGLLNALQLNVNTLQTGMRGVQKDLISVAISLIIMLICIKKRWLKYLMNGFGIISIAMLGICGYYYFTTPENSDIDMTLAQEVKFPKYHERLWRLSKTGKNVLGFFFDGFTGDHLLRILEDDPTLREKLDGFVYFPDTVAVGAMTNLSFAAIYAGPNYKPYVLNKTQPNKLIKDKWEEALSLYPRVFSEKGYDVAYGGVPYPISDHFEKKMKNMDSVVLSYFGEWDQDYVQYWLKWAYQNGFSFKNPEQQEYISRFALFMGLLRASPFSLKYHVHYAGSVYFNVIGNILSISLKNHFIPSISTIQFMKDFVTTDDGKSTFKMIYSGLSHPPCFLPPDDLLPVRDPYPETQGQEIFVNGLIPEHYYTERHMMHFFADFLASLKKLGVYDNTRIVIVSDHDFIDSWKLHEDENPFVGDLPTGRVGPNAFLIFKDFNSHAPLKISDALMSIEDTPSLLMDGIAQADGIPTLDEIRKISDPKQEEIRVRTHCGMTLIPGGPEVTQFNLDAGIFEIKGTMFKKENWRKLE